MRFLIALIAAFAAAGCTTTPPPAPEPDNTPVHPTALIETHVSSNGLKGMFPFETNERRYVRADMSRDESTLQGHRHLQRLPGQHVRPQRGCGHRTARPRPALDAGPAQEAVHGVSAQGLQSSPPSPSRKRPAAEKQKQPEAKREPGCVMHVAKKSFKVTPTGHKQDINGFDATEYRVAWIVTLRDNKGRDSTSSLKIETWTTPLTPAMREALHLEQAYDRAYARSMHERARARSRDRSEPLPPEVGKAILGYMGQLGASDRAALLGVGRELARIKGHPVRTRVDWDLEGNACAESESGATSQPESSKSFMSGLTSMFSSKKDSGQKGAGEPLFSLTYEIKALRMESVHDGEFVVPKGYQRVKG